MNEGFGSLSLVQPLARAPPTNPGRVQISVKGHSPHHGRKASPDLTLPFLVPPPPLLPNYGKTYVTSHLPFLIILKYGVHGIKYVHAVG